MGVFRFKKFEVRNELAAMKVNTDGVLLGAAMTLRESDRRLLDIGTGNGTIALMAAQRLSEPASAQSEQVGSEASPVDSGFPTTDSELVGSDREVRETQREIIGIDIDGESAREAAENFAASPWAGQLTARNVSLQDYDALLSAGHGAGEDADRDAEGDAGHGTGKFDVVFSNPPYFESSLKAPDERRRAARHTEAMSYREIISFAARRLKTAGRLSLIIPHEIEREAIRYAASFGLTLFRRVNIRTTPQRPFFRSILEFMRAEGPASATAIPQVQSPTELFPPPLQTGLPNTPCGRFAPGLSAWGNVSEEEITIQNKGGYSDEYRSLMSDFLYI